MAKKKDQAEVERLRIAGVVAPIIRTLQAGERIVRCGEDGKQVTLDLTEIAKRVGEATGQTIAVARRTPVKVTDESGAVVAELSADELMARLLSRHFGIEVVAPNPKAKATLFWCACGVVEKWHQHKRRCAVCTKAKRSEDSKAYTRRHPERRKKARSKYTQANIQRVRAWHRDCMRANYAKRRGKKIEYLRKYRAKKKAEKLAQAAQNVTEAPEKKNHGE